MSAQAMRHRRVPMRSVEVRLYRERPDGTEYEIEARCVIHPARPATLVDPPEPSWCEVTELWIDGAEIDTSDVTADEEAEIWDEAARAAEESE